LMSKSCSEPQAVSGAATARAAATRAAFAMMPDTFFEFLFT
jgi:hypothetical protein